MPTGGSSGGTTTTVQKSDPWYGQQPALLDIYGQAQNLDQTAVPQYYPGNTYAPITQMGSNVANYLTGYGVQGGNSGIQNANSTLSSVLSPSYTSPLWAAFNHGQNTLDNMAYGDYTNSASPSLWSGESALNGIANGTYTNPSSATFNQSQGVLGNELSSSYLNPWNSPSFGTVVNNTLASVIPATTASFVNGGRADSGLAQRAATMAATDAVGNLAQNQYQANQGIQQQAVNQAAMNNQNAVWNALGAAGQAGSLYGTIGGLQQGAANTATANYQNAQGNQLKAAALAPAVDQSQLSDLSSALQAQSVFQQNNQNQIAADMARYNYGQMLPWNQLQLYENAVAGTGSPGGTTTSQQPYYTNPVANAVSTVTGLGSLGLLGYMALSDVRAKTDITPVGHSDSGFPLYMFRYKGDPGMAMHIGVMAQDVAQKRPEAVVKTPSGLLAVDYSKALAT